MNQQLWPSGPTMIANFQTPKGFKLLLRLIPKCRSRMTSTRKRVRSTPCTMPWLHHRTRGPLPFSTACGGCSCGCDIGGEVLIGCGYQILATSGGPHQNCPGFSTLACFVMFCFFYRFDMQCFFWILVEHEGSTKFNRVYKCLELEQVFWGLRFVARYPHGHDGISIL